MAFREIRAMDDLALRVPCKWTKDPRNLRVKQLAEDLLENVGREGRAGLAANQTEVSLRTFSWNVNGETGHVLNPEPVEVSRGKYQDSDEDCLSVSNLSYPTEHAWYAWAEGIDLDGKPVMVEDEELMGRCLQHEADHLEGILYIDRLEHKYRKAAL